MNEKEFLEIAGEVMPHASKKAVKTREEVPEGDEKGKLWEENHKKIVDAISSVMVSYRAAPPGVTELARKTGLSRQTIYAHMREFKNHPTQLERIRMFEMMKFEVMMRLCSSAISGDYRSMKLYLQVAGVITSGNKIETIK